MKAQQPLVRIGTRMQSVGGSLTVSKIHKHFVVCKKTNWDKDGEETVTVLHSDIEKAVCT
jgi:hypothetical protein